MDGTFKLTPHPFNQINTTHSDISANALPLIYAFLLDRQAATYIEVLNVIREKLKNISSEKIILDFEVAMISTIPNIYPQTQIQGYVFQAIWKTI